MKKRLTILVSVLLIGGIIFGISYGQKASATVPGTNTLVSVNNSGDGQGGNAYSDSSTISADGRFVVFRTSASNIVSGDTNGVADIFVRNLSAGTTAQVNVSSSGVIGNGTFVSPAVISRTGRYIVFGTNATNLIDGSSVPSSKPQIYIRDMIAGTTTLVSQTSGGTLGIGGYVAPSGVSSDGRFVTFLAYYQNLGVTVPTSGSYLYLADRLSHSFQVLNNLTGATSLSASTGSTSCDGAIVVFSSSNALTTDDLDTTSDVFIADLRNGLSFTNITGASYGSTPTISCNGDFVSFISNDPTLSSLVSPTDTHIHAFLYNRLTGSTTLVDQSTSGNVGDNDGSTGGQPVAVDDQGDTVFSSYSSNLTSAFTYYPASKVAQLWLHNYSASTTEILTKSSSGQAAVLYDTTHYSASSYPSITASGKIATYMSSASNLAGYDSNGLSDSYTSLTGL